MGQGSPLPCSCYRPAAGATLQGLCRKGYADDDADDDKDDDDDGDDMMLLICSLKVVGAQRGSVLNFLCQGPIFCAQKTSCVLDTKNGSQTQFIVFWMW